MKKGFASAGMIYTLLVIFLILTFTLLNSMQSKKTVLDTLKEETVNALYCNYDTINDLKNKVREQADEIERLKNIGNATASEILRGKKASVKGKEITGTMNNITGTVSAKDVLVTSNLTKFQINTPGYYDTNDYLSVSNSSLASKIGLTADKIKKGEQILGINGTNEDGYKIYTFKDKIATIESSYKTYKNGTWTKMSKHRVYSCSGGYCSEEDLYSLFIIDLGFIPTEIVGGIISLEGNYSGNGVSNNFRIILNSEYRYTNILSVGYGPNGISSIYDYSNNLYHPIYFFSNDSITANEYSMDFYVSRDNSKIGIRFASHYGGNGAGSTETIFETRADTFYLSGYIIYK